MRVGASVKNHECNCRNPTPTWQPQGRKVGWAGKACPDQRGLRYYHQAPVAWIMMMHHLRNLADMMASSCPSSEGVERVGQYGTWRLSPVQRGGMPSNYARTNRFTTSLWPFQIIYISWEFTTTIWSYPSRKGGSFQDIDTEVPVPKDPITIHRRYFWNQTQQRV